MRMIRTKRAAAMLLCLIMFLLMPMTAFAAGWDKSVVQYEGDSGTEQYDQWKYLDDNGNPVVNTWKQIDGEYYYFDQDGIMQNNYKLKDGYYVDINGKWIPGLYGDLDGLENLLAYLNWEGTVKDNFPSYTDDEKTEILISTLAIVDDKYKSLRYNNSSYLPRTEIDRYLRGVYGMQNNETAIEEYAEFLKKNSYAGEVTEVDGSLDIYSKLYGERWPYCSIYSYEKINDSDIRLKAVIGEKWGNIGYLNDVPRRYYDIFCSRNEESFFGYTITGIKEQ